MHFTYNDFEKILNRHPDLNRKKPKSAFDSNSRKCDANYKLRCEYAVLI